MYISHPLHNLSHVTQDYQDNVISPSSNIFGTDCEGKFFMNETLLPQSFATFQLLQMKLRNNKKTNILKVLDHTLYCSKQCLSLQMGKTLGLCSHVYSPILLGGTMESGNSFFDILQTNQASKTQRKDKHHYHTQQPQIQQENCQHLAQKVQILHITIIRGVSNQASRNA